MLILNSCQKAAKAVRWAVEEARGGWLLLPNEGKGFLASIYLYEGEGKRLFYRHLYIHYGLQG